MKRNTATFAVATLLACTTALAGQPKRHGGVRGFLDRLSGNAQGSSSTPADVSAAGAGSDTDRAAAAQTAPPGLPPELAKQADEDIKMLCEGLGQARLAEDYATRADFNGDGVDDFVTQLAGIECGGRSPGASFCGMSPCAPTIWLSQPDGSFGKVADFHPDGWEIVQRNGKPAIKYSDQNKEKYWNPAHARLASQPGWDLQDRGVPGGAADVEMKDAGPLYEMLLYCDQGRPSAHLWITWPSTSMQPLRFVFGSDAVQLPVKFAGFENLWHGDLAGSRLPALLASRQGNAQVFAGTRKLGEVPLARAGETIRAALKQCHRF